MKIIDIKSNTPEWLAWRRSKITGTDAGVIIGANPFTTLRELWEDKLLMRPPKDDNPAMKRGRELEPIALELFCKEIDMDFSPAIIESDFYFWQGSSLDGLSSCKKFICEIKSPKQTTHDLVVLNGLEGITSYYYSQCQHNMSCANVDLCYYISYRPECRIKPLMIVKVEYNEGYCDNLEFQEERFYLNNLTSFLPPEDAWKFKARQTQEPLPLPVF